MGRLRLERLAAREGEQAWGQHGRALCALHGEVSVTADSGVTVGAETALDRLDIADNDSEKVVEIMRDAAGELTERFHLVRLPERLFRSRALMDLGAEPSVDFVQLRGASSDDSFLLLFAARKRLAGGDDVGNVGARA